MLLDIYSWFGSIRITFANTVNLLDDLKLVFIDVVPNATFPAFGIFVSVKEMRPLHLQAAIDTFQV